MVKGKVHMGQGQRSLGSRSNVTWVKVSPKVIILAGGLTSTSSCFIIFSLRTLCRALRQAALNPSGSVHRSLYEVKYISIQE